MDVRQSAGTPQWLFDELHARFKFTIDICAEEWNAKLKNYRSLERGEDGLSMTWDCHHVWCNPPWQDVKPWVKKAFLASHVSKAVLLLPSRTDQSWFAEYAPSCRVEFIAPGRVQYDPPPGISYSSIREGSLLMIFGYGQEGTMGISSFHPRVRAVQRKSTSRRVSP